MSLLFYGFVLCCKIRSRSCSAQENDFAKTWHLLQRLCMRCANGPVRPASPSGSVARHPRQASVGGRRMASGVSSPVLRSLLPCPMSGCALRSPSAYFAESTRVLAAEYNSPLRKAFPRFSVVAPSFSRRRCRFIRPGVGNDGGGRIRTGRTRPQGNEKQRLI